MPRTILHATAVIAVIAGCFMHPIDVLAQRHGGHPSGRVFVGGYFYDPFWGPYPWWGPGMYPYPYFPVYDDRADVRVMVTPRAAAVFVDGYYAGLVDDFDGAFQSLPLSPGGHEIAIYMDGYRTIHQRLYLPPRKSYKLTYAMQKLADGETSEMPPLAPPVPPPPPGSAEIPRPSPYSALAPVPGTGPAVQVASGFGTLAIRVQPVDAEIAIDGERWNTSSPGERLVLQLSAGRHHVEIRKTGYGTFSTDITIQPGDTTPLNVGLSAQ